jgi:thymidylate synthase (FAD)
MGDDLRVVNAARVSFNKESEWMIQHYDTDFDELPPSESPPFILQECHSNDWCRYTRKRLTIADEKLINFLAKHNHWSPFSHCQLTFEVKCPMLVKNQWYKHRIGMSYTEDDEVAFEGEGWNEMSMRYVAPEDFHVPEYFRKAPDNKKQGSIDEPVDFGRIVLDPLAHLRLDIKAGVDNYNHAIGYGVAPEQARLFLPAYAMYTSFYWTVSLFGVIRFLQLRLPKDAQWEIRQYAKALYEMVYPRFSYSFDAFQLGELQ